MATPPTSGPNGPARMITSIYVAGLFRDLNAANRAHQDPRTCTLGELSRNFGAEIAALVTGIVALGQVRTRWRRAVAEAIAAQSADIKVLTRMLSYLLHNMRTVRFLPYNKQLGEARESLDFFVPSAQLRSLDTVDSELATLASATLKCSRHAATTSAHLLTAMTALLTASRQTWWREEWLGEPRTLPMLRCRAPFVAHTLLVAQRRAVTLHSPARGNQ